MPRGRTAPLQFFVLLVSTWIGRRQGEGDPKIDLSKAKRLPRGKYAEKARRSFAVAIVEPDLFARFGSSEAVNAALRAFVEVAGAMKRRAKAKRSSRGSKRVTA